MSGSAIGTSLGFGYAGGVARTPDCVIENKALKSDSEDVPFGTPVVLNSDNTFSSPKSVVLTAANFAGVAVAEVKQLTSYQVGQDSDQSGFYAPDQPTDVIQRGIVTVLVVHGTPTAGGAVYVRTAEDTDFPDEEVGDFRADADGLNTVQLTNCSWNTGLVDANGIAELKIKSINN